jgi:capsule polysaccharide export protein KpsE/RkpR
MKIKQIFLTLSITNFMVFSLSLVTADSFAYWQGSVIVNLDTTQSATVTVGTWAQAFPWDPNATYVIGDIVTNNGVTYTVKKENPTKEPGVDKGWHSEWT